MATFLIIIGIIAIVVFLSLLGGILIGMGVIVKTLNEMAEMIGQSNKK